MLPLNRGPDFPMKEKVIRHETAELDHLQIVGVGTVHSTKEIIGGVVTRSPAPVVFLILTCKSRDNTNLPLVI